MCSSLRTKERIKNYIKTNNLTNRKLAQKMKIDINTLNTILYSKNTLRYDTEQHILNFLRENDSIIKKDYNILTLLKGEMNEYL